MKKKQNHNEKPIYYFAFLFLFLLTGVKAQLPQTLTLAKTPEEVGFSSERLKRLDVHFQEVIDKGIAPNVVTFIAKKGKIVHYKAFGYSNLESKTLLKKDDIFRIASQSKAITTVGLLMLFEEGKFFLDEPISKYIPAFKNPKEETIILVFTNVHPYVHYSEIVRKFRILVYQAML